MFENSGTHFLDLQVKYPHREPEAPVNDVISHKTPASPANDGGGNAVTKVTKAPASPANDGGGDAVTKVTKAPADDPVVPSDTASEPTRDEPTAGAGVGENRVIVGGSRQEEEEVSEVEI